MSYDTTRCTTRRTTRHDARHDHAHGMTRRDTTGHHGRQQHNAMQHNTTLDPRFFGGCPEKIKHGNDSGDVFRNMLAAMRGEALGRFRGNMFLAEALVETSCRDSHPGHPCAAYTRALLFLLVDPRPWSGLCGTSPTLQTLLRKLRTSLRARIIHGNVSGSCWPDLARACAAKTVSLPFPFPLSP